MAQPATPVEPLAPSHPTNSVSLAAVCYTDPRVSETEIEHVFRRGWFGVGRADRLADPGAFEALDVAGQRIILLRDTSGDLRAFANTCRHRGARLLDGNGQCKGIRCPFHSWFYALDGRLVSAPQMTAVDGFTTENHGLIAYRAGERDGFVFVCLDPEAPPLDAHLGDFSDVHVPWPLSGLRSVRRRELVVDCNWKAFLEVFNEYYHLPFVHRDSIDSLYGAPDPANVVTGAYATQFGGTEGTGGLLESMQDQALPVMPGLVGREANGVRYTWIFPNMTFAAGRDGLWLYEAFPLGPNRCQVFQTACFPSQTVASPQFETKLVAYLERLDTALDEDIPALENQQRGFGCPDAQSGPFQPLLEANVAAFARWYRSVMCG